MKVGGLPCVPLDAISLLFRSQIVFAIIPDDGHKLSISHKPKSNGNLLLFLTLSICVRVCVLSSFAQNAYQLQLKLGDFDLSTNIWELN
jgi:hypothetical protein